MWSYSPGLSRPSAPCCKHSVPPWYTAENGQVTDIVTWCQYYSSLEQLLTQESWDHLSVIIVRIFLVWPLSCRAVSPSISRSYSSGTKEFPFVACSTFQGSYHEPVRKICIYTVFNCNVLSQNLPTWCFVTAFVTVVIGIYSFLPDAILDALFLDYLKLWTLFLWLLGLVHSVYLVSHSGHNIKEPGSMYLAFDFNVSSLLCYLSSYSELALKLYSFHLI